MPPLHVFSSEFHFLLLSIHSLGYIKGVTVPRTLRIFLYFDFFCHIL